MSDAAERYARLHAVFEEARSLRGDARREVVDRRCAGDAALRQEVEDLLREFDRDDSDALSESGIAKARDVLEGVLPTSTQAQVSEQWMPDQVGPYRIVRRVAEGGMGVVYEAEQESPRRRIALKVVHPLFVTDTRLKRFRQEAELLGRLHHPGIAQIFEAGSADLGRGEQPYFAMEYVEGLDLASHAREGKLPLRARLELLAKVCDAIQHAHEMGVIHRDLKPDNVLVDGHGQPKVLDFGVARAAEGSTVLTTLVTEEGDLLGTIAYMAPEQFEGKPDAITLRADVYALGVIAFELLAGRLPHDLIGLPLAAAMSIARDKEPDRLGSLRPELAGDVETIVGKALEKEAARRYASAADLAADLRAYLANRPITARPPSRIYRAVQFTRRHRALVAGTATTLLAVLIGLAASLTFAFRSERDAQRALEGERRAMAGLMQATQDALERGKLWEAARTFQRIQQGPSWETDLLARALPIMPPQEHGRKSTDWATGDLLVYPSSQGVEVREPNTWRLVRRLLPERDLSSWFCGANIMNAPVMIVGPGESMLFDPTTFEVVWQGAPAQPEGVRRPFLDNKGRLWDFEYEPGSGDWVVRTEAREVRRIHAPGRPYLLPDPSGSRGALISGSEGWIEFHDLESGQPLGRVEGLLKTSCSRARWMPDGQRVLAIDIESRLVQIDADQIEIVQRHPFEVDNCSEFDLSADGRLFATSPTGTFAEVFDLWTDQVVFSQEVDFEQVGLRVQLSPSLRYLRVLAEDLGTCILDREVGLVEPESLGTDGDPRAVTFRHPSWVRDFAVSPDGRMVASLAPYDTHLRVWDLATGAIVAAFEKRVGTQYPRREDEGYQIAFTPDGRVLSLTRAGLERPELMIVDPKTGVAEFEELAPGLAADSLLPFLDRFLEALGPAPAMRIGQRALLLEDGTALAAQVPGGFLVEEGRRWQGVLEGRGEEALDLSPDGTRIAVACVRDVRIVDRRTDELIARFPGAARSIAWSPDGRLVAVGDAKGRIRLIDAELGCELYDFRAHRAHVLALDWTPDGTRLISGSEDHSLRVWDPRPMLRREADAEVYEQRVAATRNRSDDELFAIADSAESSQGVDERWAAIRVLLERIEVEPIERSPLQLVWDELETGEVSAARQRFDSSDRMQEAWEVALTQQAISLAENQGSTAGTRFLHDRLPVVQRDHESYIYSLAVSPGGRLIASTGPLESTVLVWDATSGETLARLPKALATSPGLDNRGQLIAFSADGRSLLVTARHGVERPKLFVYDLLTGEVDIEEPTPSVQDLSHASWIDRFVERLGPRPAGRLCRTLCLLADGSALTVRSMFDSTLPEGDSWRYYGDHPAEGLALSPDGTRGALAASGSVRFLDRDGNPLSRALDPTFAVAWSPDGRRVAIGRVDGRVALFDGHTFDELMTFQAHDEYVYSLAWTPDGTRLVTASGDRTARVFDVLAPAERAADQAGYREAVAAWDDLSLIDLEERFEVSRTTAVREGLIRAALERRARQDQ